jgi:hypothetical protein
MLDRLRPYVNAAWPIIERLILMDADIIYFSATERRELVRAFAEGLGGTVRTTDITRPGNPE